MKIIFYSINKYHMIMKKLSIIYFFALSFCISIPLLTKGQQEIIPVASSEFQRAEIRTMALEGGIRKTPPTTTRSVENTRSEPFKKSLYAWCLNDNSGRIANNNIIAIDAENPANVVSIAPSPIRLLYAAGDFVNGVWYGFTNISMTSQGNGNMVKINPLTGELEVIAPTTFMPRDVAYDYKGNTMYVLDQDGVSLKTVDLKTGRSELITFLRSQEEELYFHTIACSLEGTLYLIGADNYLYELNTTTYKPEWIGLTQTPAPYYLQSMTFDHNTGTLYWASSDMYGGGFLYTINTKTGLATQVGTTSIGNGNIEAFGLVCKYDHADNKAPAAVNNLIATPGDNGTVSLKLTWDNPSVSVDGTALQAISEIRIYRNNNAEPIATISNTEVGETGISWTDPNPVKGLHSYEIAAVNESGKGIVELTKIFIGEDKPAAITNLNIISETNKAQITWTAPEKGINGGWFDPAKLSYKITRTPGNVIVAEDHKATSFLDESIHQLAGYTYTVTAVTEEGEGGSVTSEEITLGECIFAPWENSLSDEYSGNSWTYISNTNVSWAFQYSMYFRGYLYYYTYMLNEAAGNDWAFTPPIYLEKDKTYEIKWKVYSIYGGKSSYNLTYGYDNTIEAHSNILYSETNLSTDDFQQRSVTFTATATGNAYLGWHGCSGPEVQLQIQDLSISPLSESDLNAIAVKGEQAFTVNKETSHTITVKNVGKTTLSNFTVFLLDGKDNILGDKTYTEELAPDATADITIDWTPSDEGDISLRGKVSASVDGNPTNDISSSFNAFVVLADEIPVAVGTQKKQNHAFPICLSFMSSLTQTIYYKNEINKKGTITAIEYLNSFTHPNESVNGRHVKIYMTTTTKNNLNASFLPLEDFSLVYNGLLDFPNGENLIHIPLDFPYTYLGEENLVVMVKYPMHENRNTSKTYFKGSNDPGSSRSRWHKSGIREYIWHPNQYQGDPSDDYADIVFVMKTEGSPLSGELKDEKGYLFNVDIHFKDNPTWHVNTGEDSRYFFDFIPEGNHTVVAEKHGYIAAEEQVAIVKNQAAILNFTLTPLTTVTVSGKITGISSDAKVKIGLSGYDTYIAQIQPDGTFSIPGVYENHDYILRVSAVGYRMHEQTVAIKKDDIDLGNIVLELAPIQEQEVIAIKDYSGKSVDLSWSLKEEVEFRFDNGNLNPERNFGYSLNSTHRSIIGTVYKTPAEITEISWFLTEKGGPHATVHLYIMGIDDGANPTSQVLWHKKDVPNTDMQWNTFALPEAVYAPSGFFIGISYDGYLGLAMDVGNDTDWPYVEGRNFSNIDFIFYRYDMVYAIENYGFNFLLRAKGLVREGEGKTATKSASQSISGYNIYRGVSTSSFGDYTKLTASPVKGIQYTDDTFGDVALGNYKYAVVTVGEDGSESAPVYSNIVKKEGVSIPEEIFTDIFIYPNPTTGVLYVENSSESKLTVRIFNVVGKEVYNGRLYQGSSRIDLNGLTPGMYFVKLINPDTQEETVRKILLN